MTEFVQQVVSGLATGGIYASLALGLVIVYRTSRLINFAQGEMATVSTFIAWTLINHGLTYWLAFFLTLLISFAGGAALEQIVIRPVARAPVGTVVIVTLGLFVGLNGLTGWIWGNDVKAFPSAFSTRPIHVGGVSFSIQDLGIIGVSLGAVGLLYLFFQFTKVGLALRAAAVNPEASRLVGVRVAWMLALGWGISAALGALSGMMVAPLVFLDPNMMLGVLLYGFTGAVLGGLSSPGGAVAGGFAVGVIENLAGTFIPYFGRELKLTIALLVIVAVLVVRPSGIFGRAVVSRV